MHEQRSKQTPAPEGSDYYQAFARLPLPHFRPGGLSIDLSSDPWLWQVINEAGHLNNCNPGLRHQAWTKSADRSQPTQGKWGVGGWGEKTHTPRTRRASPSSFTLLNSISICVWACAAQRACVPDWSILLRVQTASLWVTCSYSTTFYCWTLHQAEPSARASVCPTCLQWVTMHIDQVYTGGGRQASTQTRKWQGIIDHQPQGLFGRIYFPI